MGMNQSGQPPIADFMSRVVAWIIDGVILGIAGQIVWAIVFRILPFGIDILVQAIAVTAISAGYFIYTWTSMRGTSFARRMPSERSVMFVGMPVSGSVGNSSVSA